MSDDPSPWPERERTQYLLFGAGALLLVPVILSLSGVVELGGAVVVGLATVASALLVYGLLGWGGNWVAAGAPGDATDGADRATAASHDAGTDGTDGDNDDETPSPEAEG